MKTLTLTVLSLLGAAPASFASTHFSEYILESYLIPAESIVLHCEEESCETVRVEHFAPGIHFTPVITTQDEIDEWSEAHPWATRQMAKVLAGNESILNFPDHQFEKLRSLSLCLGVTPVLLPAIKKNDFR